MNENEKQFAALESLETLLEMEMREKAAEARDLREFDMELGA